MGLAVGCGAAQRPSASAPDNGAALPSSGIETEQSSAADAGESAVASPRAFRIATFNLERFGPKKASDPEVLRALVEVVRRYELVAVQEIKDSTLEAAGELLAAVNAVDGPRYAMLESERTGLAEDDRTSQEQYAFYFDTERVRAHGAGALYPDTQDVFQREPFVGRIEVDGWRFALVDIHTAPERAVAEVDALADVVAWVQAERPNEPEVIALGDFNARCDYASRELDALRLRDSAFHWLVPDDADTNVAASACAYDRIVEPYIPTTLCYASSAKPSKSTQTDAIFAAKGVSSKRLTASTRG